MNRQILSMFSSNTVKLQLGCPPNWISGIPRRWHFLVLSIVLNISPKSSMFLIIFLTSSFTHLSLGVFGLWNQVVFYRVVVGLPADHHSGPTCRPALLFEIRVVYEFSVKGRPSHIIGPYLPPGVQGCLPYYNQTLHMVSHTQQNSTNPWVSGLFALI